MAKRRMFSLDIIDTDLFLEMPQSSRLLYYELCMRADDDGFVSSPKKIQKMVGCNEDDFKVLISKKFLIPFDTGVVVIKHWKIHNYIQKDRYKETIYLDEKSQLSQEKNGMYTKCIQDGYTGKVSLEEGKVSLEEEEEQKKENNCISFYMENINPLITPHEAEVLNDYNKDLSDEVIIYAIKDAIEHKATNMKYIKKILNRYIQQGIKTIEQLKIQENIEEQKEVEYEHELTYTDDDFTPEQYDRLMRREMSKEEMIQILKEKKNV